MTSPDNRIIKASFRECPISDRKQFKSSHCLLTISVGQPAHEDKKFEATLKLINDSFSKCTILAGDILQRHNLKTTYGLNESEAYKKSLELGNAWLERNYLLIERNMNISYSITRWNDWLEHKHFEEKLQIIRRARLNNESFQLAFEQSVREYLERKTFENINELRESCMAYLEEECAVMTLWTEKHYDFEVYPSGRNKAMAATYELLIKDRHPSLLRPVALRFKKYPAPRTALEAAHPTLLNSITRESSFKYEDAFI